MTNQLKRILRRNLHLLCLVALLAATALAQKTEPAAKPAAAKQQPPPPGPVQPFSFPQYQSKKLANGLTIFVIEDHRQPLVSYQLVVNAGGISHSPAKAGLASLTGVLLRQGTASRSAQDIARTIDNVGGNLSISTDDDTTHISATVMKPSEDLGVELLSDVVMNPVFKQEE